VSQTIAAPAPVPARGLTWQKLLLGDWTRFVRDPLDVCRILFIVATIVWGLLGHSVTGLIAASFIILLARAVSLPRFYDLSVIVVMVLLSWGSAIGLYGSWGLYDNVVHFIVPLLTTGMIYILLVRLGVVPELRDLTTLPQKFGFFLTVLALGMAIGAGWEVIEWLLDQLSDVGRVGSADDTATDLISDTLGSALSAFILVLWSLGRHSLTRRPGAELADKRFGSFLTLRKQ
jgi:uncharacterized membrane protein YjdF